MSSKFVIYLFVLIFCCPETVLLQPSHKGFSNKFFGSKTPYDTNKPIDWEQVLLEEAKLAPTCRLLHVRLVARHGTRSPDIKNTAAVKKAITKLADASDKHASTGSFHQIELRNETLLWRDQLPHGKRLIDRGRYEQQFLARDYFRLMQLFGSLSPLASRSTDFRFETSETGRSFDSGVAFREEWLRLLDDANLTSSSSSHSYTVYNVTVNDDKLYFAKNCSAITAYVDKNEAMYAETKRVRFTSEAEKVVTKINKNRLGLPVNALDWNNIFALYQMAAFESAALNRSSLLALFDDDDLEFLEYADELDYFWRKAYGHPIIGDVSCVLTTDIFETAYAAIAGRYDNYLGAMFEFAHLETLLSVYSAFDLFDDNHDSFRANASRTFIKNRNFKTSKIAPFAGNFAFLFFLCPDPLETFRMEHKVMLMVNGRPQALARACSSELACPLFLVRRAYGLATGSSSDCDLRQLCHVDEKPPETSSQTPLPASITATKTTMSQSPSVRSSNINENRARSLSTKSSSSLGAIDRKPYFSSPVHLLVIIGIMTEFAWFLS